MATFDISFSGQNDICHLEKTLNENDIVYQCILGWNNRFKCLCPKSFQLFGLWSPGIFHDHT